MIKSLKRNDIRYTPFIANKSWNSQNQRFEDLISWQSGSESGSLLLTFFDYGDGTQMSAVSSAFSAAVAYQQQDADFIKFRIGKEITGSTFFPLNSRYYNNKTNPVNIDESYQSLVYNTTKNLYYKESENPTQMFGLESLDTSKVNRTLPKQISVFNVPLNKFGEKIEPNSVKINHDLPDGYTTVIDDGNNNLKISGSSFSDIQNARYNCVSAELSHRNLTSTYDGTEKSASIYTIPSGLITSTTYNGSSTFPINAGIYSVFSEISDGFYCGNKTDNLIINKAVATVTVNSVSNTYNGNRYDVTVTTSPPNLNYKVTYRKNSAIGPISNPVDIGTYYATVIIDDINYSGTGQGTSTITVPTSIISFNSIPDVYYGQTWEIQPIANDNVNNFPIKFTITAGNSLAEIADNKISLNPSKTATSLGSVIVKAETVPNIAGASSVSVSKTFTITQKELTVIGIYAEDKIVGTGTSVTINNQNKKLEGIIQPDVVSINSYPSTGTISSDIIGTFILTLSSNYTITGTHASKYTLKQPSLLVKNIISKIFFKNSLSFTYDTKEVNANDILTNDSLKSIDDLTVNYYSDSEKRNLIGLEKYINGKLQSNSGKRPTDFGIYWAEFINNNLIVSEIKTTQISIQKAKSYVELENLVQGGSFCIDVSQKSNKIKPISDEILDVKITKLFIKDRYSNTVDMSNLIKNSTILYNNSTVKPSSVGNYEVTVKINSLNVLDISNSNSLKIQNYVYVVLNNLYQTYNFTNNNLVQDYTSSVFNLKKYFDPSVTGSWATITSTYPELSDFPYQLSSGYGSVGGGYRYQVNPYLKVGLTGGGGGAYIFNDYKVTNKNVYIEYYDVNNNLAFTTSSVTVMNSDILKSSIKSTPVGQVNQTTHFFVSQENVEMTFTLTSNDAELYIDDTLIAAASNNDNSIRIAIQKRTFKRGYYKLKLIYYPINGNSKLGDLVFNPEISFTTLISYNYGGGSGASIGVTLPAKYIIDKNLQQVKFVVGQSGYADSNQDIPEITSRLNGQPAQGSGNLIANGYIYQNNLPLAYFLYNAPLLRNYKWLIATTPQNSPSSDLIFVGKDVTQAQLNDFGIKTELSNIYRIKAGDKLDISSTATVDDYLSIGYYVWDATLGYSSINKSYNVVYLENYQDTGRQYSKLSGQLTVPSTFKSTDILVIGFEDSSPYRRGATLTAGSKGLNDLIVSVKLIRLPIPYNGGDTYFVTGSSTTATIQNAYLGLVAGGGRTINNVNYGSSSVKGNSYRGMLYPVLENNESIKNTYPLYSEFKNYDEPLPGRYSINYVNWTDSYNQSIYGNNGQSGLISGQSVDVSVITNKNFGRGAGGNINYGNRGNFVLSGSNILYEIYVNSSSVYNVTQVT